MSPCTVTLENYIHASLVSRRGSWRIMVDWAPGSASTDSANPGECFFNFDVLCGSSSVQSLSLSLLPRHPPCAVLLSPLHRFIGTCNSCSCAGWRCQLTLQTSARFSCNFLIDVGILSGLSVSPTVLHASRGEKHKEGLVGSADTSLPASHNLPFFSSPTSLHGP